MGRWHTDGERGDGGVLSSASGRQPLLNRRARRVYAARSLATAIAESVYHRTAELREVGGFETRVELRVYLADFRASSTIFGNRAARGCRSTILPTTVRRSCSGAGCSSTARMVSSTAASGTGGASAS